MTVQYSANQKPLSYLNQQDGLNNQFVMSGVNESIIVDKGTVLLVHIQAAGDTTLLIKDGRGRTLASGVSGFTLDHNPWRLDYGIQVTGDVAIAIGYIIHGCFIESL